MSIDEYHFHEKIISSKRISVKEGIDTRDVLDRMGDALSKCERENVIQLCKYEGDSAGASKLLDILTRRPSNDFIQFVHAVRNSGREDLAKDIYNCVPIQYRHKFAKIHIHQLEMDPDRGPRRLGEGDIQGAVGWVDRPPQMTSSRSETNLRSPEVQRPQPSDFAYSHERNCPGGGNPRRLLPRNIEVEQRSAAGAQNCPSLTDRSSLGDDSNINNLPENDNSSPLKELIAQKVLQMDQILTEEVVEHLARGLAYKIYHKYTGGNKGFQHLLDLLIEEKWTVKKFADLVRKQLQADTCNKILFILENPISSEERRNDVPVPPRDFYPQPMYEPARGESGEATGQQCQTDQQGLQAEKGPSVEAGRIREDVAATSRPALQPESDPNNDNAEKGPDSEISRFQEDRMMQSSPTTCLQSGFTDSSMNTQTSAQTPPLTQHPITWSRTNFPEENSPVQPFRNMHLECLNFPTGTDDRMGTSGAAIDSPPSEQEIRGSADNSQNIHSRSAVSTSSSNRAMVGTRQDISRSGASGPLSENTESGREPYIYQKVRGLFDSSYPSSADSLLDNDLQSNQTEPNMHNLDQTEPNMHNLDQIEPNMSNLDQTEPDMPNLNQTEPNMPSLDQTVPKVMDQTEPHNPS